MLCAQISSLMFNVDVEIKVTNLKIGSGHFLNNSTKCTLTTQRMRSEKKYFRLNWSGLNFNCVQTYCCFRKAINVIKLNNWCKYVLICGKSHRLWLNYWTASKKWLWYIVLTGACLSEHTTSRNGWMQQSTARSPFSVHRPGQQFNFEHNNNLQHTCQNNAEVDWGKLLWLWLWLIHWRTSRSLPNQFELKRKMSKMSHTFIFKGSI